MRPTMTLQLLLKPLRRKISVDVILELQMSIFVMKGSVFLRIRHRKSRMALKWAFRGIVRLSGSNHAAF